MTRFPLLPPPVHPSIHPRMRSRSHSACVHLRVPLVPRAQSSSAAGPGQVTQPQGVPGCHSACTSSVIVCLPGAVCSRCSECPSPHRPRTWWPLPASCRHSPHRGYLPLLGGCHMFQGAEHPRPCRKAMRLPPGRLAVGECVIAGSEHVLACSVQHRHSLPSCQPRTVPSGHATYKLTGSACKSPLLLEQWATSAS